MEGSASLGVADGEAGADPEGVAAEGEGDGEAAADWLAERGSVPDGEAAAEAPGEPEFEEDMVIEAVPLRGIEGGADAVAVAVATLEARSDAEGEHVMERVPSKETDGETGAEADGVAAPDAASEAEAEAAAEADGCPDGEPDAPTRVGVMESEPVMEGVAGADGVAEGVMRAADASTTDVTLVTVAMYSTPLATASPCADAAGKPETTSDTAPEGDTFNNGNKQITLSG
jgi:hypothetical protein